MSRPEKSKQTFVQRQERTRRWRYGYRKIDKSERVHVIAVSEYSESFSENDQSTYQERSAVTNDFNHPSKDYANFICAH